MRPLVFPLSYLPTLFLLFSLITSGSSCTGKQDSPTPHSDQPLGLHPSTEIIKKTGRIFDLDPRSLGFSSDDYGNYRKVWEQNKGLSLQEFYKKYAREFLTYDVHLRLVPHEDAIMLSSQDGKNGQKFTHYQWNSPLEKELAQEWNDIKKAKIISRAYHRHILPIFKGNAQLDDSFKYFIKEYHNFFGSRYSELHRKLELFREFSPFSSDPHFIQGLQLFTQAIQKAYPKPKFSHDPQLKKIVIITGPYGAGHLTPAYELKSEFLKGAKANGDTQNLQVTVLNECTDFPDTLFLFTGKYHSCKIYNDIVVSEVDPFKEALLKILNTKLADYRPTDKFTQLYERLKLEEPDLLISTVHHIPQITAYAYLLDVPLRILVTDFEFPERQWPYLNHVNQNLVKYWIPSSWSGFFRSMVNRYYFRSWVARVKGMRTQVIYESIFQNNRTFEDLSRDLGVFEVTAFPISQQIRPPRDHHEEIESRKKLELSSDRNRKVILIANGGSANSEIVTSLVEKLLSIVDQIKLNTEIAILSSGNSALIQSVASVFKKYEIPVTLDGSNRIPPDHEKNIKTLGRIFGRLTNPEGMSDAYKASNLVISKSGGASTAEFVASQLYFIRGFPLWNWEVENTKYLEHVQLALSPNYSGDVLREPLGSYLMDVSADSLLTQINILLGTQTQPPLKVEPFSGDKTLQLAVRDFHQFQKTDEKLQTKESQVLTVRNEILASHQIRLIALDPFARGAEGDVFLAVGELDHKFWAVKILKNSPIALGQAHATLLQEHETFSFLRNHGFEDNTPKSHLLHGNILLKEFISGDSLFSLLREDRLTQEMAEQLYDLFSRLCKQKIFVSDLHGLNLKYSPDQKKWVIIDTNGYRQPDPQVYKSYRDELVGHWEVEYNDGTKSQEERDRFWRIHPILLDRLQADSTP